MTAMQGRNRSMLINRLPTIGLLALSLSGCATIIEGTGQSVAITTTPPGAACTISRQGETLGQVVSTPGSIRIDKSKNDLTVACAKPGYQTATLSQSPTFNATTFGNIVAGGVVGAVVDASTGANYEYPAQIIVQLAPAEPVAPAPYAPPTPPPYALPPRQPGV
jgi:hypothetical protein